jgi:hypothetical protein
MVMAKAIKMRIAFPSFMLSTSAKRRAPGVSCIEQQTNWCCCHAATALIAFDAPLHRRVFTPFLNLLFEPCVLITPLSRVNQRQILGTFQGDHHRDARTPPTEVARAMASYKEMLALGRDPARVRAVARRLLASAEDWTEWERDFLEGIVAEYGSHALTHASAKSSLSCATARNTSAPSKDSMSPS